MGFSAGRASQRRSIALSRSGKTARISSAKLSPSLTSRLRRCWVRSCSLQRFSTLWRWSCHRISKTTGPPCSSTLPRNGRSASTACIAAPRKLPSAPKSSETAAHLPAARVQASICKIPLGSGWDISKLYGKRRRWHWLDFDGCGRSCTRRKFNNRSHWLPLSFRDIACGGYRTSHAGAGGGLHAQR
jgi:hypothetical protein